MQNENIFADGALDRILFGELETHRSIDGRVNHFRVRGFRQESEAAMRRGSLIIGDAGSFPDVRGVYAAAVTVQGIKRRKSRSGFFPAAWTRCDIERAIAEAYEGRQATRRGGWFKGQTSDGMKLLLEIDGHGRVLDAMPETRAATPKRRKPTCSMCGETLIKACPRGHGKPSLLPKRLRWFKRWVLWMWRSKLRA